MCAGLAERFDLDPIVVRILAILIALLTVGLGVIAYAILWMRLPREDEPDGPYEVTPESAESSSFGSVDCETGFVVGRVRSKSQNVVSLPLRLTIAIGLMILFLVVAINVSPLVPGTEWWQFWPLALLISGLCLIVIPVPTSSEASWHALGIVVTAVSVVLLPISLDVMAWETLPYALSQGWLLVVAAAFILAAGIYRKSDTLIVTAAFFIVAFCVFTITMCALPGAAETLTLRMPDGRSLKIAFTGL